MNGGGVPLTGSLISSSSLQPFASISGELSGPQSCVNFTETLEEL